MMDSEQWNYCTRRMIIYLTALIFVYDYHPGAETLLMRHFSGPDSTLSVSPDGTLLFPSNPRPGGVPNRHRPGHRSPMPERLIWSYIIQLSSALRTVHAAGLACRVIDPSKILLIGNSRQVTIDFWGFFSFAIFPRLLTLVLWCLFLSNKDKLLTRFFFFGCCWPSVLVWTQMRNLQSFVNSQDIISKT